MHRSDPSVTPQIVKYQQNQALRPAGTDWRRGDSNRKHLLAEGVQSGDTTPTNPNAEPLERGFAGQIETQPEQNQTSAQHEIGAPVVHETSGDPDLLLLTDRWPRLPEHIRAAIKALVQSVAGQ